MKIQFFIILLTLFLRPISTSEPLTYEMEDILFGKMVDPELHEFLLPRRLEQKLHVRQMREGDPHPKFEKNEEDSESDSDEDGKVVDDGLEEKEKLELIINGQPRLVTNYECNRDFLGLFELYGRRIDYAYLTTIEDHDYCFTDYSCCTNEHFENILENYAYKIYNLREQYQPIIELLSFFRGGNIKFFIRKNKLNDMCVNILLDNDEDGLNFLDFDVYENYRKLTVSFIDQIKDMVEMKESWFGNMLCIMCSPKYQKGINWNEETKILEFPVDPQLCNTVYKFLSIEIKMMFLFKNFVSRIADFMECSLDMTLENYTTRRRIIYAFEEFILNTSCFNNFNEDRPECLKMCSNNIRFFQDKRKFEYRKHVNQTLKLFFKALANVDLEQHYSENLNKNINDYNFLKKTMMFSTASPIAIHFNLAESQNKFTNYFGFNPYTTPISFGFWNQINYLIEKQVKK